MRVTEKLEKVASEGLLQEKAEDGLLLVLIVAFIL